VEQLAALLTSASTLPESVVLIDGQEHCSQVRVGLLRNSYCISVCLVTLGEMCYSCNDCKVI